MPGITSAIRSSRHRFGPRTGLLAATSSRRLAYRASRPGTPGLIAPGPGFTIPQLRPEQSEFSQNACSFHAAQFVQNLLRAGVARPTNWFASRDINKFLQHTLQGFVGERAAVIDRTFRLCLSLSPTPDLYCDEQEKLKPERVLLSFQVIDTVASVNLTPALELLAKDHDLLPSFFYHSLQQAMSRWFRVFDLEEARWRWNNWLDMREAEEDEESPPLEEPALPPYVEPTMPKLPQPALACARSKRAKALIKAVESLADTSQRPHPDLVTLSQDDCEELYVDTDPDVPMLALAFGEHDVITEFLNQEIENAGQVVLEPWPTIKMDGTQPESIRDAFACANVALDTLVAAARVLLLVPGFQPFS